MNDPLGPSKFAVERLSPRSQAEWIAEGKRLFGHDWMKWRFVCPGCGHIASVQDWKDAGAGEGAVAFSCVGRWLDHQRDWLTGRGPGPCNYAGGGLFGINPVPIIMPDGTTKYGFDYDRSGDF